MNIVGIDFSKNSPGVCRLTLDKLNFEAIYADYRGFTSVKKIADSDKKIIFYHNKKAFTDDIAKAIFMRDNIYEFINADVPDYVAIEGYAMNAQGKVFDIAESTAISKVKIYENEIPIRIYDPNSIKKYASLHGDADKIRMEDEFKKFTEIKPDLSHLPEYKSPKEDIIDAFWTAKLLQMELMLRKGLISLHNLHTKRIEVFNRVTKSNPENILVRPFIKRGGWDE